MTIPQRVACFEFIRDIPYHIGLNRTDPNYNCVAKCAMLARLLGDLGLKTREVICTFDWAETELPADILSLPRDPGEMHQFLQVYIPETKRWVNCDPTWNRQLKKAGFAIAKWDGLRDTSLAVKPHHLYDTTETAALIKTTHDPETAARHMRKHRAFYKAINAWLDGFK